jgi:ubiquinone/menaquinone biosynthesis C-methylase UbiE
MIPAFMTRQVAASQDALLQRMLSDTRFVARASRHPLHAHLGEALASAGPAHVLELGCGPGKYVAMLSTLGHRVTGIDPLVFPTWPLLQERTSVTLLAGVVGEALPFPDAHFDHVVCLGTLLYVQDPDRTLAEIVRVVKPGGRVVLRTVNRGNLYTIRTGRVVDPASRNLYSMDELLQLVRRHGLQVDRHYAYGLLPPGMINFWWYLTCVWLPVWLQDVFSAACPAVYRWNNTVLASLPSR